MTLIERGGLALLKRAIGHKRAKRASFAYRDRVQPALETLTYRASKRGSRSDERLRALRGKYAGQRCFIIGNGPSLTAMDLTFLRSEYAFALNRGYLLFDRIGAPTTFLVAVNRYVVEQFGHDLVRADSMTFVSWRARRWVPPRSDVTFVRRSRPFTFSSDVAERGAWEGATVTYVALQLAYHLGFSDVILIGVDHSFSTVGPANQLVTSPGADPNHFDPAYFGAGVRWQLPDLEVSEVAYRLARDHFEADGRLVRDATVGGRLDVFPKVDLESVI